MTVVQKEFSDQGTRAMKETTAYMMTEVMKTVLYSGTGRDAYISWLPQAGKTGTSNYTDEEIENHIKTSQFVAPDEMFVGYTRKYQWQSGPVTQTALLQSLVMALLLPLASIVL